jgi:glycosyltransferase involved in cell wall biosynthesis
MPPLVSVLLPTFNRSDVVGYAIESVLSQTLGDFELLVVGDGCTDSTADVVQGYRDPRLKWFDWPKTLGFGYAARNRALRLARGHIVAYLAHDDLWLADHLERAAASLAANDAEWSYSRGLDASPRGLLTPQRFDLRDPLTRRLWLQHRIGYLSISQVVHLRSCVEHYGWWHEQLPRTGDWELWRRILNGGKWQRFAYDPIPTSMHFVAAWRRGETWRRRVLRDVQQWEGPLAPELSVQVPDGVTEQEAVWRAMSSAPLEWAAGVRQAIAESDQRRFARPLSAILMTLATWRQRLVKKPPAWPPYEPQA